MTKALVLALALFGGTAVLGPSGRPEITFSSTGYCVGDSWTLKLSSAEPTPIALIGTSNGKAWEIRKWAATDSNGYFSKTEAFALAAVGKQTLQVYTDYWNWTSDVLSYEVLNCGVWGNTKSLNIARAGHQALLLPNGKVLVMGGSFSEDPRDVELYDPATETWSLTGQLNTPRYVYGYSATVLPNGKVLVAGGYGGGGALNSAELYDPETGTWSATGDLNTGRAGHTATLLPNGQVLVGIVEEIAQGEYGWRNETELYNPDTGTWRVTGSLLPDRSIDTRNQTVTVLPNGKVLLVGGIDNTSDGLLPSWTGAALYDPATETWRMTRGPSPYNFGHHTATLLANGKVFVAEETGLAVKALLYDPETETWSPTGILSAPLNFHTVTLLPNGKVLLVGAIWTGSPLSMISKAEIYDPDTGTWSASAPLKAARFHHSATLLSSGKILVAGGTGIVGSQMDYLASAELYDGGFEIPVVIPPVVPPVIPPVIPAPPKIEPIAFSIPDRGSSSLRSSGTLEAVVAGYAAIQPGIGNATPSGLAIFGLRQNNVLVSEASVPATPLIQSGRIYAEVHGPVNTGLAIANPNDRPATVSFFFTSSSGDFGSSSMTIPANGQIASFLNQSPFNGPASMDGTFTFNSSVPVAVLALRGLTNDRSEFLVTTLPVADLGVPPAQETVVFPHFADGGGWTTQIVLVNPTDSVLTGRVEFRDQPGQITTVAVRDQPAQLFPTPFLWYSIPARSSQKLQTIGGAGSVLMGSVRVVPAPNTMAPSGVAVFSLRSGGTTVAEAGVPALPAGSAFRLYAEASGEFGRVGSIQTGLAAANNSASPAVVSLELSNLDSSATGLTGTLSIPGSGQVALFLNQIPEFSALPPEFRGILRVSSAASLSVVGVRGRYNERNDFLFTTTPPVNEAAASSTVPLYFPHIVDSGGYTTQFILFGGQPGPTLSGTINLFSQTGEALDLALR